jgi:starch synthase
VLSAGALAACQRMGFAPAILHANDWHTALLPLFLRTHFGWDELFKNTKTVLTLHNLGYQGMFPSSILPDLGLDEHAQLLEHHDLAAGRVGFMKTGILYANAVTAVSETYAREIQTEEHGFGLDGLLRARSASIHGITNGVDYDVWSPEIDALIPQTYSASDLSGKTVCKNELLSQLNLAPVSETSGPVFGIVSRLTKQKGFELGYEVLPRVMGRQDVRLVVLGSGDPTIAGFFEQMARAFPQKVAFVNRYDDALAHRIEAGADVFLMPSFFEPCGLNQMYSLKYGTIPIVRRVGGLADTVDLWDPETRTGTGISFDHFTSAGFGWAVDAAVELWKDQAAWRQLQQNAMAADFSWGKQVEQYVALYRSL